MLRLIKQVFIALLSFSGSLASMADASNLTTCMSLNNQRCMTQPTLINVNAINDYDTIHFGLI